MQYYSEVVFLLLLRWGIRHARKGEGHRISRITVIVKYMDGHFKMIDLIFSDVTDYLEN